MHHLHVLLSCSSRLLASKLTSSLLRYTAQILFLLSRSRGLSCVRRTSLNNSRSVPICRPDPASLDPAWKASDRHNRSSKSATIRGSDMTSQKMYSYSEVLVAQLALSLLCKWVIELLNLTPSALPRVFSGECVSASGEFFPYGFPIFSFPPSCPFFFILAVNFSVRHQLKYP